MNQTKTIALGWVPVGVAVAGALMLISACGPQDGSADKSAVATAKPQPVVAVAPAVEPAREPVNPAPAAAPAPKPAPVRTTQTKAVAPKPQPAVEQRPVAVASANLGSVQAIEPITEAKASGAGAVVGGLLGGVVGNQFGKGDGKKAMTVVGAVGGAVAGHEIEKTQNRKVVGYRVRVQLDNGDTRTFEPTQLGGLKVGDRVRVDQGALHKA
jgi:outer membrane lipoprotein SlyB